MHPVAYVYGRFYNARGDWMRYKEERIDHSQHSADAQSYSADIVTVSDNIGGDIDGTYMALSW